jgi:hypothetical protein
MAKNEFSADLPRVRRMLADGDARITDTGYEGRTALFVAAAGGSISLLTLMWLLEVGGARITERDHDGQAALLCAASFGRIMTCQSVVVGTRWGRHRGCRFCGERCLAYDRT